MYCLSPDHIESHIPDAIHEIQKWMADIRTNEEFDIIANPKSGLSIYMIFLCPLV